MAGDPTIMKIPLTKGHYAIVDAEDYEDLSQFSWYATHELGNSSRLYASRRFTDGGRSVHEKMHRRLLPGFAEVDHINGNGLDNRQANLRPATRSTNSMNRSGLDPRNSSGFRGVSWNRYHGKWHASIKINKRKIFLGYFVVAEEAARVYDAAALELFGEYHGYLNFPAETP